MITSVDDTITVPIEGLKLKGSLYLPDMAKSLVIFSHGSGSSRFSPRNNFVAQQLQRNNIGSFLFDLLTKEEDQVYANRFDIDLLAKRLIEVTRWLEQQPHLRNLNMGYFGASTGSASALVAAAQLDTIRAIVSRGGRPDLVASAELATLKCPALFIVGELDREVWRLHQLAVQNISSIKKLEIVPGASHLFEEADTLETVSKLAVDWFQKYL